MRLRSKKYQFAITWIATNDNDGNGDTFEDVAGYISTALVADTFDVQTDEVARDVMAVRAKGVTVERLAELVEGVRR